ncbi:MAG: ABC transporter permease [Clostridium sp.]|nr:ABC transporter permease [Clostridium sp.]
MTQLYENILLAISGLRANKMRALLTMLGIIIGIGSVIGIVMVGDSMTNSMTSSLQEMGANTVQISLQQRESENGTSYSVYMDEEDYINDEMIEAFLQDYGDVVESVSLQESMGSGRVTEGHRYANVSISGVNSGYQSANHLTMLGGRFIGDKDNKGVKNVAVVSDRLVNNMFGQGQNPLGKEIKVNCGKEQYTFTIIGVYQYEQNAMMAMMGAASSDADITTDLFIPIQTEWKLTGTIEGYYYINVMTKQGTDSRALAQDFQDYFNRFYTRNQDFQIMAISLDSVIDQYASMMGTVQVAIAVIAAISLLVGGIGVMNIMLVSVTERTREIGTRKALGAKNSAIRMQFIVESVIICLIGGIIGIIFGMLLGYAGASLLGFPAHPSVDAILIAVCFSMAIGVFFGYYPANKAAKLDPIEALRYE